MTLFAPPIEVECPNCGTANTLVRMMSTHSFGSPDLDLRPAPDQRDLLELEVECCRSCGLSHVRLDSALPDSARETLLSEAWERLARSNHLPPLALAFKRAELILAGEGELADAAWMALKACWACDDENSAAHLECRLATIRRLEALEQVGLSLFEEAVDQEALKADLYRRCGLWDEALACVARGIRTAKDPILKAVLRFQGLLASRKDDRPHKVEEAKAFL